ncbi:hypothetical protein ACFWBI_21655 [Streptomyces sp. NPDC059982]|uniref:hypothetical protein n=1 Tax=unclassified Streptomyces TaxID=2593676 RepID=UPI00368301EA
MGFEGDAVDGERAVVAGEVGSADEAAAGEEGADVVAVDAAGCGFAGLEDVGEAEEAMDAGAVPEQVVERAEEDRGP